MSKQYHPINRWNLTGKIVRRAFSYDTAAEAEAAGRDDAETYQDQKFDYVFHGTWLELDALITAETPRAPTRKARRARK